MVWCILLRENTELCELVIPVIHGVVISFLDMHDTEWVNCFSNEEAGLEVIHNREPRITVKKSNCSLSRGCGTKDTDHGKVI